VPSALSTTRSTTTTRLSAKAAVNNVVLRPSQDPEAFDSFKIGGARVHRYIRDNDETEAEYVMWYHGRSANFDSNKELPPLTTGRIGRATSLNGLVWKKCLEGSESEDAPDVTLGLNKESWWGFDTAHVGLGQVLLPMSTPAVMTEGGIYLMYYMGGNFQETPIANYLQNAPETDATIKGMQMKIGVAVSQDGISWGRVEGDDPSGACMSPYDSSDPNTKAMAQESFPVQLEEELYCGWPDVVVHNDEDVEIAASQKGKGFYMYYSTMRKSDKTKCLAYAISPDGFRWIKKGICLEPDDTGLDADGCARCTVIPNAEFNEETSTWKNVKGWTMYYEGVSKVDCKHRVLRAESADGGKWEKRGVALDVGESQEVWDHMGVGSPHILRLDDGSMRMYYTGQGSDGSTAIGLAKFDSSTGRWAREQAEFSFAL
jgi:hypothetical protein